jgi:hypothetical protein
VAEPHNLAFPNNSSIFQRKGGKVSMSNRSLLLFSPFTCVTSKLFNHIDKTLPEADMAEKDIRWVQRYSNYAKALEQLSRFIKQKGLNELEKQGLIQAFEYTYELAWNTIKDK